MSRIAIGGHQTSRPGSLNLRRWLVVTCIALAAVAAVTLGYRWLTVGRFFVSTDDAYVGGDVTPIAPHIAGFVARIAVEDNQHVRRGQLLVQLDDRDFRAAERHAEAVLGQKRAALDDLEARLSLQQTQIHQANAQLAANVAAAAFARDDDARYQGLARAAGFSRQDVQRAISVDGQARANVDAARAGVAGARRQVDVLAADIAEAQADVAQAEADLETARLNLSYARIESPVDGYVGNRAANVGAYVTAGSYLASIVPAHGLWVDANFKEDQLARIRPGDPAAATADILPGRTFHGHVASLSPASGAVFSILPPENATGNFTKIVQRVPVRIVLDSADATLGGLRPGLSITAKIDTRGESAP